VSDLEFGNIDLNKSVLYNALTRLPKTSFVEGQDLLNQAYETSFGIHDHNEQNGYEELETDPNKKRPLSSVAMHFSCDTSTTSRLYEMMRIFKDKKVYQNFGLSLTEFLEYPPDLCDHMLLLSMEQQEQDYKTQQNVLNNLNGGNGTK
jgi:hypothetical protein